MLIQNYLHKWHWEVGEYYDWENINFGEHIKKRIKGEVIFKLDKENNTIKDTVTAYTSS